MTITKDGNMYMVAGDNFVNLQESSDYFFISEEEYKSFKNNLEKLAVIRELAHWVPFFSDESMNDMSPSERLTKRIEKLHKGE